MVGTSNRSDGGRPLVVGMVVAACMGGLYVGLTSLFGIRPGLLAGTILAIAVGATVSCFSSSDNFVPSGAGAAAITLIALMASRPLWSSQQRAAVLEDSCSDESCIHALAETAMWRIAQDSDSEGGGGNTGTWSLPCRARIC